MIPSTHSTHDAIGAHGQSVRRMFAQIAHCYDLMNRLMSAGQDSRWRRSALEAADLRPGDALLDVAAGTGEMVFMAQSLVPDLRIVAADFTPQMMRVGKQRARQNAAKRNGSSAQPAGWAGADTYALPFPAYTFDAVTSAFLLRNLADPLAALREQVRVLKPGGRLVTLDATPPRANWLRPFVDLYLNRVIPLLGGWISGQPAAYRHLSASIASFHRAEAVAELFLEAGLLQVRHRSFMVGTATMVAGVKRTQVRRKKAQRLEHTGTRSAAGHSSRLFEKSHQARFHLQLWRLLAEPTGNYGGWFPIQRSCGTAPQSGVFP